MTDKLQFSINFQHISDTIAVMRCKEVEIYEKRDYLCDIVHNDKISEENLVNEICREKMTIWFYQVIDTFKLNRIIANIAMSYLDKYLGTKEGSSTLYDRMEYQLVAMCCLELAVKIHEPRQLNLQLLSKLSRGAYSQLELKQKEKEILSVLRWRMCPPTASCFAGYYLHLLPQDLPSTVKEQIRHLTMFQIENSIKRYSFIRSRPSEVALASVLNAMTMLQCTNFSLSDSFYENIILVTRIDPTNVMMDEVRNELRNLVEDSIPSLDIMLGHKTNVNDVECEYHNNISPKCTRNKQCSQLMFSDVVGMSF